MRGKKYNEFWKRILDKIIRLFASAYHLKPEIIDVSDLIIEGQRENWYAKKRINRHGMVEGVGNTNPSSQIYGLGNVVLDNKILEPYGDTYFVMTIFEKDGRLLLSIERDE